MGQYPMYEIYFEHEEAGTKRSLGFASCLPDVAATEWIFNHLFPINDSDYSSGEMLYASGPDGIFWVDQDYTWKKS